MTSLWHAGQEGEISSKDQVAAFPAVRLNATAITVLVIAIVIIGAGIWTLARSMGGM